MRRTIVCKICGEVLGHVHGYEVSGRRVSHMMLKHPNEWEELSALRQKAFEADREYRMLRHVYGVTERR